MTDTVDLLELKDAIETAVGLDGDWAFSEHEGGLFWHIGAFSLEGRGDLPHELEAFMENKHTACDEDLANADLEDQAHSEDFELDWFSEDEQLGRSVVMVDVHQDDDGKVIAEWSVDMNQPICFRVETYTMKAGVLVRDIAL